MTEKFTHLAQLESLRDALVLRSTESRNRRAAELRVRESHDAKSGRRISRWRSATSRRWMATRGRAQAHAAPADRRQRREDDQLVLVASVSDEFEIDTLLHTDDELSFRRPGVGADVLRKLRRGEWVIQDEIDLHGCAPTKRASCSPASCATHGKRGLRCIRVVHGKGLGSKGLSRCSKGKTQVWLAQREDVIAFCQARADRRRQRRADRSVEAEQRENARRRSRRLHRGFALFAGTDADHLLDRA